MEKATYQSIQEKEKIFFERYTRISTQEQLDSWLVKMSMRKYIFRGLKEAKYKNLSSAQRYYMEHNLAELKVTIGDLIEKQIEVLGGRNKKGVLRNLLKRYYQSLGVMPNDFLYLSFAQHYGGVSPLIDFTRNYKKAFFFMTTSVYIIDIIFIIN